MEKDERIKLLEELQTKLHQTDISGYELQERIDVIENMPSEISIIEYELAELNNKLADERNYYRTIFLDELREDNCIDAIELANMEKENAQKMIAKYKDMIPKIQEQINAQTEYLNNSAKEHDYLSDELMDSEDMGENEFSNLRNEYELNSDMVEAYKENIDLDTRRIKEFNDKINEITNNLPLMDKKIADAQHDLEQFKKDLENDKGVDLEAVARDKNKARELQELLDKSNRKLEVASYNHEKELYNLISAYKKDEINDNQVIDKVKEIQANMHDDYIVNDILERSEEQEAIKTTKEDLQAKISKVQEKLANDDNYLPSIFIVKKNEREITKKLTKKLADIEERVNFNDETIEKYSKYVEQNKIDLEDYKKEKYDIGRSIRKAGNNIDPEFEKQSLERIKEIDDSILLLAPIMSEDNEKLEYAIKEKKILAEKQERYTNIYNKKKETLDKRNGIDFSAKRLDGIRLQSLQADLVALENYEKFNDRSVYDILDVIIKNEVSLDKDNDKDVIETDNKEKDTVDEVGPDNDVIPVVPVNNISNNIDDIELDEDGNYIDTSRQKESKENSHSNGSNSTPNNAPKASDSSKESPVIFNGAQEVVNEKENKKFSLKKILKKLKKFIVLVLLCVTAALAIKGCDKNYNANDAKRIIKENPDLDEDEKDKLIDSLDDENLDKNAQDEANKIIEDDKEKEQSKNDKVEKTEENNETAKKIESSKKDVEDLDNSKIEMPKKDNDQDKKIPIKTVEDEVPPVSNNDESEDLKEEDDNAIEDEQTVVPPSEESSDKDQPIDPPIENPDSDNKDLHAIVLADGEAAVIGDSNNNLEALNNGIDADVLEKYQKDYEEKTGAKEVEFNTAFDEYTIDEDGNYVGIVDANKLGTVENIQTSNENVDSDIIPSEVDTLVECYKYYRDKGFSEDKAKIAAQDAMLKMNGLSIEDVNQANADYESGMTR